MYLFQTTIFPFGLLPVHKYLYCLQIDIFIDHSKSRIEEEGFYNHSKISFSNPPPPPFSHLSPISSTSHLFATLLPPPPHHLSLFPLSSAPPLFLLFSSPHCLPSRFSSSVTVSISLPSPYLRLPSLPPSLTSPSGFSQKITSPLCSLLL
jgi:hypothetical protein